MDAEKLWVDSLFKSSNGMSAGYDIVGDNERSTASTIVSRLAAQKPSFVHIIAHGILEGNIPKIRLLDGQGFAYDAGASEFYRDTQTFNGIKLIFFNLCYALARTVQDDSNFEYVFLTRMNAGAVIGTAGSPWTWAAAFLGLEFWAAMIATKTSGNPIYEDNINDRMADALSLGKSNALNQLATCTNNVELIAGLIIAGIIGGAEIAIQTFSLATAIAMALCSWCPPLFAALGAGLTVEQLVAIFLILVGILLEILIWVNANIHLAVVTESLNSYVFKQRTGGSTGGGGPIPTPM
jgi:hypothetical protein